FGLSISSVERERFSDAGAAGAGCSFFCLAAFLAGLVGAPVFEGAAGAPSRESAGTGTGFGSVVFGSSGFGVVGFSGSAIVRMTHLNFAGFGFRIANDTYGLARSLARPGVRRSALSAHG